MRGIGLIFAPKIISKMSLRPSRLVWGLIIGLFGLIYTPNSPIGKYNPPLAAHLHPYMCNL